MLPISAGLKILSCRCSWLESLESEDEESDFLGFAAAFFAEALGAFLPLFDLVKSLLEDREVSDPLDSGFCFPAVTLDFASLLFGFTFLSESDDVLEDELLTFDFLTSVPLPADFLT